MIRRNIFRKELFIIELMLSMIKCSTFFILINSFNIGEIISNLEKFCHLDKIKKNVSFTMSTTREICCIIIIACKSGSFILCL